MVYADSLFFQNLPLSCFTVDWSIFPSPIGKEWTQNDTVEGLLIQLIHDLSEKEMYQEFEAMEESQRRVELLLLLFDRVKTRRDKVRCV